MKKQLVFVALAIILATPRALLAQVDTLPYFCTFEDPLTNSGWTLANGTSPNKWINGTAIHNGGSAALYISNDGSSYKYTFQGGPTLNTAVYAYKTVTIPATILKLEFAFDWTCNPEDDPNDLGRAFLVPDNIVLTGGSANGMGGGSNPTPANFIDIGGGLLQGNPTWSRKVFIFDAPPAGQYNIVFFWKNNVNSGNEDHPLAVDNVSLQEFICANVTTLTATPASITSNSATLTWTPGGSETEWEIAWKLSTSSTWNDSVSVGPNATYNITGLIADTTYDVRVRAVYATNVFSTWTTAAFRTLNTQQSCDSVTHLHYTSITDNEIAIAWTAGGTETDWTVTYTGHSTPIDVPDSAYTLTGLNPATTYHICVKAVCAATSLSTETCIDVTTVDITTIDGTRGIILYPNPATEQLTVVSTTQFQTIEVCNMLGQTLFSAKIDGNQADINIADYTQGIYFVKLHSESGTITKKFTKK